uniref:Uncharacterized protein n=1 Tax=Arundo donax TaxID=35708 RepID=A0A0A8YKT8_ARUDO
MVSKHRSRIFPGQLMGSEYRITRTVSHDLFVHYTVPTKLFYSK